MNDVGTNLIGDPVSNPVSVLKAHSQWCNSTCDQIISCVSYIFSTPISGGM